MTHALSGALLARATLPRNSRISAAARIGGGFIACAFPDIDVVLNGISPIAYLTLHRGLTHSLVLLPAWAFMLAWIFANIDRGRQAVWRDYFGICALAIGLHIVGDLITSFGTMIYAPFSDARIAWNTTFIIDLWFTAIIVTGLAAATLWRDSRLPAVLGLAMLTAYVGFQALQREHAVDFGQRYAQSQALGAARVSAIPRPVSPFNWLVMVTAGDTYHYANVNLVRVTGPTPTAADAGFIARLDAAYAPLANAHWISVNKYGADPGGRDLARRVFANPRFDFYRRFAAYPRLYRIDSDPSKCVWFEDLRFTIPGRESSGFRYGLCREDRADRIDKWRVFRLLDDDGREALDAD